MGREWVHATQLGSQLIKFGPLIWPVSDFGGTPRSGVKTQGGETSKGIVEPASPHRLNIIFTPKYQPLTSLTFYIIFVICLNKLHLHVKTHNTYY